MLQFRAVTPVTFPLSGTFFHGLFRVSRVHRSLYSPMPRMVPRGMVQDGVVTPSGLGETVGCSEGAAGDARSPSAFALFALGLPPS